LLLPKIGLNIELTTVEDFDDNQPLKKSKCSQSSVSDYSLSSPTISTSSMVRIVPNLLVQNQMSKSALSPFSKLMNKETISKLQPNIFRR
jgi:hypothetical protein